MDFGIVAACEGSLLDEDGVEYSKPLVPLCGFPMMELLIDIFIGNGAEKICVIVNEHMTEVRLFLEKLRQQIPVDLEIVVKTTPSSMHSFYELGKLLKGRGRFIVITVDTIFHSSDFSRYVDAYCTAPVEVEGMMALTSYVDDEKPLYVETDKDMNILAFLDSPAAKRAADDTREFVSGGIYGLSDKAVDILDDCLRRGISRMRNYQRALVEAGLRLKGYDMGKIIDVDHAEDIRKAEKFLQDS